MSMIRATLAMTIALSSTVTIFGDSKSAWEEITLKDLKGNLQKPLVCEEGEELSVVIFITTDCPIANALIPEMNRLDDFIAEKKGKLTLVHVDWELESEDAIQHASDFQIKSPVVIDRKHELVQAMAALMTPEAVLLDPQGKILYQGRINNLFTDYGDRRKVISKHDLRTAIEEFVGGRPVTLSKVAALGCYIPELPN